jgi:hypothetical protein
LQNEGNGNGNVIGAAFQVAGVTNTSSPNRGSGLLPVLWKDGPNFKEEYLAPIVGFEFNFTGGTGNMVSVLPWVSGAVGTQVPVGTITYTASSSSPMAVLTNPGSPSPPTPPSCSASGLWTREFVPNAFYTPLEPVQGASNTLTQSFDIVVQQ